MTIELRARRPDLTAMSERQLWERFEHLLPVHQELFAEHIFTSYMASVPAGVISTIADAVGRPDLVLAVLGGIGDVDSAAPSHAMWALSRIDRRTEAFADGFARFLFDFGSRGPNEWEARSPTWETRPALAIAAIDRMRAAPDSAAPAGQFEVRALQRQEAAEELLDLVKGDVEASANLDAAIGCSTAWLPGRERTKTNCIRLIHEMRVSMREIGRRMVERGVFDEIEDFGFVRAAEIDVLLEGDASTLTSLVRERRAQYESLQTKVPPFVFVGSAEGPESWPVRGATTVDQLAAGEELRGLPGCPGVAEGPARIILDPHDAFALEPGDVLVAPITDPSWTPLFVPAAAVVVDVGAALSHAIIVSRELGIPCVVSATDATRRIPDGAWIQVDGGAGVVTVLEV
jgi:pyruvate,water dikinase